MFPLSCVRAAAHFYNRGRAEEIIIIIICYIYIALFKALKALYIQGGSPRPPPMCSSHLDDATAAILRQNAHHTPAYWWRGDRVMKPISVWGWLGGHDGQRPMGKFGQDAGVTPLLFFEGHPGIFNDHRESGPRFNVSSEGQRIMCRSHTKISWESHLIECQ